MWIFDMISFWDKDKPTGNSQPKNKALLNKSWSQAAAALNSTKPQQSKPKWPEYSREEKLLLDQVEWAITAKISAQNVINPITLPYSFDVVQTVRPGKSIKKDLSTIEPKIKDILESRIRQSVLLNIQSIWIPDDIEITIKFIPWDSVLKININIESKK